MKVLLAATLALLATAPAASAMRPNADLTPGCASAEEYNSLLYVNRKTRIDATLHMRDTRVLLFDDIDFTTGEPFSIRDRRTAKYIYEGCTGEMWVIYRKHDGIWYALQKNYDDAD